MRILFVCMIESVTAVRWVDQLRGTGWDVHVFPSVPGARPHAGWRDVTLHGVGLWRPDNLDPSVRVAGLWPWRKGAYRAGLFAERLGWRSDRARLLAATVQRLKPDIVHSLEMQHAGYLTLDARRVLHGRFPRWIYSSWGSDLYQFRREESHGARIREVLATCDAMMTDCRRDQLLARESGFRGDELGVFPGGGGFDVTGMQTHRGDSPSRRKVIAVKGYQNEAYGGRALMALQAVHRCADAVSGYEVVVYGAQSSVRDVARHIGAVSGLRIEALERMPHDDVIGLLGRSRIHVAVGTTDGTPNAMLEAMIMGAFPIQSDTVSTGEWIRDGENGLLVPAEDVPAIEAAIRRAVSDDDLVDSAAQSNQVLMREKAERVSIRKQVLLAYENVKRSATGGCACGAET